jgi:hypothetical protein
VTYAEGQIIEYTSFDPSGYSPGEVIRYAPDSEQWLICPNCAQQAVPAEQHGDLQRCPRCQAFVRFTPSENGLLVYVRTLNPPRCKPFLVRESQLRPRKPPGTYPGPGLGQGDRRTHREQ